ncbi:MAG: DNA mismatch repair endonuclease MutL [Rickettsiales bacterium]
MSIIRELSPVTISRIAAGEVVERPASVIKELVENSLDAGADEITITIENAGKNLIIVEDNGCGMDKEDISLAVERHATSKLIDNDLLNIKTFGFRGEALPSVGSVSRLTIKSKPAHSENGWCITVAGGEKTPTMPAMLNTGTVVEVRDLFFATPARLKFLRTERTEIQHITDIIKRMALVNPQVKFTFRSDDKEIFSFQKEIDLVDPYFKRIEKVMGKEFAENSINVNIEKDNIKIKGYISLPTYNRGTSSDTYLYINGRAVKDKLLHTALRVAYQDFISSHRYPVAALFLEVPFEYVDVNVHPSKTEVRFRDVPLVRNIVISGLKKAVYEKGQKTSSTIASDTLNYVQRNMGSAPSASPSMFSRPPNSTHSFSAPRQESINSANQFFEPVAQDFSSKTSNETYASHQEAGANSYPLGAAMCQMHETYIVSQTNDSIVITDQHAAHERLVYESLKNDILNNEVEKQRLLIPEIIEIDEYNLDKILAIKEDLLKLGLNVEKLTDTSIVIHEIPHILGNCNTKKLVQDIVDDLIEFDRNVTFKELLNHVLGTYACHHSIRSGRKMNTTEMNSLLREMEATPHSGQCNHGRPTYIELKLKDIEKLFGRS